VFQRISFCYFYSYELSESEFFQNLIECFTRKFCEEEASWELEIVGRRFESGVEEFRKEELSSERDWGIFETDSPGLVFSHAFLLLKVEKNYDGK